MDKNDVYGLSEIAKSFAKFPVDSFILDKSIVKNRLATVMWEYVAKVFEVIILYIYKRNFLNNLFIGKDDTKFY
jgi:hypothetical protein